MVIYGHIRRAAHGYEPTREAALADWRSLGEAISLN
jgi:hypothetical protein